jgi:predicted CXXCH cytochrome family protein
VKLSTVWSGKTVACLALILAGSLCHAEGIDPDPEALEKTRAVNAKCLECHVVEALRHPPKAGIDLKKLRRVVLDPAAFASSSHGRLACTKCHTEGYTEQPHARNANEMTNTCSDCHSRIVRKIEKGFEASVHARNLTDIITCLTCHDPHVMRSVKNLADPSKIVFQHNRVCLGCHDSDATFAKYAPEKRVRPVIDDIHSWLPNARMHWKAVRCVECHTPLSDDINIPSHEIVKRDRAEKKCVSCHSSDSTLTVRLYRHLAKEEQHKYGFLNSVILGNAYIISATRNPAVDGIVIALAGLTLFGVLVHGLLRFIAYRIRRSKSHD